MSDFLLTGQPCQKCTSSDAASLNTKGWWHCFSCEKSWREEGDFEGGSDMPEETRQPAKKSELESGDFMAIPARGLLEETCRKYGYAIDTRKKIHIAPYKKDGRTVGQKIRSKVNGKKKFRTTGNMKATELFGQHLFGPGKIVVVTEGELDALSVSQAQQNKWPAVSLPLGAPSAKDSLGNNVGWLSQFEKVILMFDDDKDGHKAAQEGARALPVGKAYLATIPGYKDASEALVAGRADLIVKSMWNAQEWRPDGLVKAGEIRKRILEKPTYGLPFFDERLTRITYGRHPDKGQVFLIGAGIGIGKTAWLAKQLAYDLDTLKIPTAGFFMESDTGELYQRIASIIDGKTYHLADHDFDEEGLWETIGRFDELFTAYDSYGAADLGVMVTHIRYLAAKGVRNFYVDNLTQLTDESKMRESVEEAISTLVTLASETKSTMLIASHLATPEKGSHEEGAKVSLRHFYGSRKLPAWVDGAFGLERNTVSEDPVEKLRTTLRALKIRLNGSKVGSTMCYAYDDSCDSVTPIDTPINDEEVEEF